MGYLILLFTPLENTLWDRKCHKTIDIQRNKYSMGFASGLFLIFLTGFTIVPITELALLIKIGQIWGLRNTLLLVILTGIFGAILLKIQGVSILRRINNELGQGIIPSDALFDGFFIFCGGLLLITPGVVTDLLGFLMLFPITRGILKYWVKQKIKKAFEQGRVIRLTSFRRLGKS